MNFKTKTLASIYELQGHRLEALEIYKDVLKSEPQNIEIQNAIKRLNSERKTFDGVNLKAKEVFVEASNLQELKIFERWLMKWN